MYRLSLYICIALCITACGPKVIYDDKQSINDGWSYDSPITFDFEISDTTTLYDMKLQVAHNKDYQWENFYVNVATTFPDGKKLESPLSIELANKNGIWLSECGSEKCLLDLLLRNNVKFPQVGSYRLEFTQDSRQNPLKDITALGLEISVEEK